MADYSIADMALQVVNSTDGTEVFYVNSSTGEVVEALKDEKFAWRERKKGTLALADIFDVAALPEQAEKLRSCSTWLEFLAAGDLSKRELHHFNACKRRLCPLCSVRKARVMSIRLEKILRKTLEDHPGSQLIFLTLTLENCEGDKLRDTLDLLTEAWRKLTKRRPFDRAVMGWFRALEVTRNRSKDNYHPHIHAILVVQDAYFKKASGLYITHEKWVEMWQQCLKVDYKPIVGIERTRPKAGEKVGGAAIAAALEAAKYATKSTDYINSKLPKKEAARVASVYLEALNRKRMTALGGWMLKASQELGEELENVEDLVHDGEGNGELTEATAELLEEYGWHFGVGDHLLSSRRPNPDFEGASGGADD